MFAARNRYNGCHKMDCSELGIARAPTWAGPYVLDALPVCDGPLCRNGTIPDWRVYCEDPYYWRDADGTWHALCNSKDCPSRPPEPPDPTPAVQALPGRLSSLRIPIAHPFCGAFILARRVVNGLKLWPPARAVPVLLQRPRHARLQRDWRRRPAMSGGAIFMRPCMF